MSGWVRLEPAESATNLRLESREVLNRWLLFRAAVPGRLDWSRRRTSTRTGDRRRAAGADVTAAIEARPELQQERGAEDVFRDQWGAARHARRRSGRHRARAGRGPGGVRAGRGPLAARWPAVNPTGWVIATAATAPLTASGVSGRSRPDRGADRELREGSEETMDETATFADERLELIFDVRHRGARARCAGWTDPAHARRPLTEEIARPSSFRSRR